MGNFISEFYQHFIAVGIVFLIVAIYFKSYRLNKATPLPKGCEDLKLSDIQSDKCKSCTISSCAAKSSLRGE